MKLSCEDRKLHGQAKVKKFWLLCGTGHTHLIMKLHLETGRTVTIHRLHGQEMTNTNPKDEVYKESRKFTSSGVATKLIAV